MKRYNAVVLVRVDPDYLGQSEVNGEREYKISVTTNGPVSARRMILERAWGKHWVISRFLSVTERELA